MNSIESNNNIAKIDTLQVQITGDPGKQVCAKQVHSSTGILDGEGRNERENQRGRGGRERVRKGEKDR